MNKLASILIIGCGIAVIIAVSVPVAPLPLATDKIRAEAPVAMIQQEPMPGVWRTAVFEVTAYCGCEKCCGTGSPGITASGSRIDAVSHFLAAPDYLPFGTVIRIPGYAGGRPVVVLDRGGAIKGLRLDTYHETHAAARKFGRQILTVQIWENNNEFANSN